MVTANWAGNVVFSSRATHHPTSVAQVQELVAGSDRVRALGSGHSFSRIADTTGDHVSLAGLPPVCEIDRDAATVTVSGGLRYGEITSQLHEAGFALPNLGSLPHIAVAGACATGTHGSGQANGSLATAVSAVELVGADGELRTVRRGDPDFAGSVVALGAVGVVTALTLDLRPTFDVRQYVYEGLALDDAEEALAAAYSVSLLTRWKGAGFEQVWLKQLSGEPEPAVRLLGATRAPAPVHMVPGVDPRHCTPQLGEPGPWHERLPHFRLAFTPSSGDELQSEYFVPRAALPDALRAVDAVREKVAPVLQVSEIRTVAADDQWLSPAEGRDSAALHFTWVPDTAAVLPAVAALENALEPLRTRPHWGKVFGTAPARVAALWPRMADFSALARRQDPTGKFRNAMLDTYVPL
ncbi:D-arabinono-1,4-lactone oxidase [Pseudonocardia sp. MH-G8]|uniref:D-arabinono-1,4-lactone oxidase n=1 Tax=Pseudonocardia sp. MH-G8 TaxID=1854588 RepID=UPI000BA00D11|nr:D-arabinono-1,4-lactone oxidase [Pseudonocardia sp. MH-G8]OZM79068.1 FAD-binding protein [Pseudonocardia sp. MH-G8]